MAYVRFAGIESHSGFSIINEFREYSAALKYHQSTIFRLDTKATLSHQHMCRTQQVSDQNTKTLLITDQSLNLCLFPPNNVGPSINLKLISCQFRHQSDYSDHQSPGYCQLPKLINILSASVDLGYGIDFMPILSVNFRTIIMKNGSIPLPRLSLSLYSTAWKQSKLLMSIYILE